MKKGENYSSYNSKKDIPLVLDSYNDLFSDFDPRPSSQRALSKDFLFECQKASVDKKGDVEIKLLINKKERSSKEEGLIIKRIKEHFNKHFLEKKKELFQMRFIGLLWFLFGCFLIVLTTFLDLHDQVFLVKVLVAISHPAGWFFLWEGLGKIIIHSKEKREECSFNKKMSRAKISFLSIK